VLFVKVPQAVPVHAVPESVQVTPLLLESLLTVAVKLRVCPWSMFVCAAGVTETEMAGGAEPPPQAFKSKNPDKMDAIKMDRFITSISPFGPNP
jgi:hypothetical protein